MENNIIHSLIKHFFEISKSSSLNCCIVDYTDENFICRLDKLKTREEETNIEFLGINEILESEQKFSSLIIYNKLHKLDHSIWAETLSKLCSKTDTVLVIEPISILSSSSIDFSSFGLPWYRENVITRAHQVSVTNWFVSKSQGIPITAHTDLHINLVPKTGIAREELTGYMKENNFNLLDYYYLGRHFTSSFQKYAFIFNRTH